MSAFITNVLVVSVAFWMFLAVCWAIIRQDRQVRAGKPMTSVPPSPPAALASRTVEYYTDVPHGLKMPAALQTQGKSATGRMGACRRVSPPARNKASVADPWVRSIRRTMALRRREQLAPHPCSQGAPATSQLWPTDPSVHAPARQRFVRVASPVATYSLRVADPGRSIQSRYKKTLRDFAETLRTPEHEPREPRRNWESPLLHDIKKQHRQAQRASSAAAFWSTRAIAEAGVVHS